MMLRRRYVEEYGIIWVYHSMFDPDWYFKMVNFFEVT